MTALTKHIESIRGAVVGLLLVFSVSIIRDSVKSVLLLVALMVFGILAIYLAKKTAHHFHSSHTHEGDSVIDSLPVTILILVNIFHPAVDGFTLFETTTEQGIASGLIVAGSIVLHEIVRQGALITAFLRMGIKKVWLIITTALFGIFLGVGFGFLGSELLHIYEWVIDLCTFFAYVFIISEFWYANHDERKNQKVLPIMVGVAVGVLLLVFASVH
jgi:hypothetical protein